MASLADDLASVYDDKSYRPLCSIAILLAQLNDKDRGAAATAVDDLTVRPAAVSKWLAKHGHTISPTTIRRHRRRMNGDGCSCPKSA